MKLINIILISVLMLIAQSCSFKSQDTSVLTRTPASIQDQIKAIGLEKYENLSDVRKAEITVFKNNLFKYMLHATHKSDEEKIKIFNQAQLYFELEGEKIFSNINNELKEGPKSAYLEIIEAPPWTLIDEVAYLNEQIAGKKSSLSPQSKLMMQSMLASVDTDQMKGQKVIGHEVDNDSIEFIKALQKTDSESDQALIVINKFETKVSTYFDQVKHLGTELQNTGKLSFENAEKQKFVVLFLDYYYSHVNQNVIKNILNDAVMLNHTPTNSEMIQIMFQNSGPGLGKTIQQLGKEPGVGESLSEIMEILEDDGKSVPYYMVDRLVKEDTAGFVVKDISEKPLGTGTMAQVNKATLVVDGKDTPVALRYLKPGIRKSTDDDVKILNDFITTMIANGELDDDFAPTAKKLIKSIETFLYEELDINDAIKKQAMGKEIYDRSMKIKSNGEVYNVKIKVPEVYSPKNGVKTNLHIQEFITFGQKFSKIENHSQQEVVTKALVSTWFEEALIKSGFVHSDLHQGNFTVKTTPGSKEVEVVIFDFGLSGKLSMDTRRAFLYIGAGHSFDDPDLIARGLANMDKKATKAEIKAVKKQVLAQMGVIESEQDWILWALKNNIVQSDEIGTLARGASLVTQLGKVMEDERVARDAIKKMVIKTSTGEFFSIHNNFPLSRAEMARFGTSYSINGCVKLISRFFK